MNRRSILKSVAAAATAAAAMSSPAFASTKLRPRATTRSRRPATPSHIDSADGVRLFVRDWGDGEPMVFLHGWALASDMWNYQMVPLSEQGLRCIAYDRRGHGRSSDPGRDYDYDTLADDLAAVLDTLDLHGVTLVGHSMAAGELVRYLSRHGGDRIKSLVFVAPAATPFLLKTPDNPQGIDGALFEHYRRNVLLRDFPKWLQDNARPFFVADTSPEMIEWVASLMRQASMKAVIECNRAMTTTDFRAELPKIAKPTLVIHGDRDASAPLALTGKPTADLIPGAELNIYKDGPHGLFITHMTQLNDDLRRFATRRK